VVVQVQREMDLVEDWLSSYASGTRPVIGCVLRKFLRSVGATAAEE